MLVVTVALLISSCSSTSPGARDTTATPPTTAAAAPTSTAPVESKFRLALARVSAITTLGDSVPSGAACKCTPYPQLTAANIARVTGHAVRSFNDSVAGFVSGDVIRQLQHDETAIRDVEKSDAVMIEVGANDIAFSSSCGTDISCYVSKLPKVTSNITNIVARVRRLTAGRHITVVLLDYWSVWLGGRYARARGPVYVGAARAVTLAFGTATRTIALDTGSVYVDLRTAFRGPDDDRDETKLLAGDGDHPNAEGHERIADAIVRTLQTT